MPTPDSINLVLRVCAAVGAMCVLAGVVGAALAAHAEFAELRRRAALHARTPWEG